MPDASSRDYMFYPKDDYFRTLLRDITSAQRGSRIIVASMNFDPKEPLVHDIVAALATAAKRGVHANLVIDARDFLQPGRVRLGPLWYHDELPKHLDDKTRQRIELLETIRSAGGTVGVTNQPHHAHSFPAGGRSHIKAAVIGDKVYVGGCNLSPINQADLMVSWHDPKTADWLFDYLHKMAETENTRKALGTDDLVYTVDSHTQLFIDAGVKRQSRIFDEALAFIDEAQDWLVITCQFFPHGVTAQHLVRATKRGVRVRLIYNQSWKHGVHMPVQQAVILNERLHGRPRHYFTSFIPNRLPYIHAKLIASEKGAMLGSHNYVIEGVRFGTAEIAVLRRDPGIGRQAVATMEEALNGNSHQHPGHTG